MTSKTKTTAIKEEAKPALVPKLRFPDFRETEGWETSPLGELGAIVTGKTPSTKEDDLWGGEILFITPTDITEGQKYQHSTQRTVVETTGTKVLPPGSVVYTCIASIGKMALTVAPSVTNQQINAVVPNGKTAREFIYYSLANLTPWIKSIPATSTLPIINKTQFSQFIIPHPADKQEQQKIAECLSSLDTLITLETQKLEALKTHKKGLMQQLFPRAGETVPRLRFPEFQNAGEWEILPFKKIFLIGNGRDYKHLSAGNIPVYGSGGYMCSVNEHLYDGESVCIGRKGTINNPMLLNGKFWTVDTLFYTHSFQQCLPQFIYAIFQNIDWLKHNEAGGIPSLSKANIEKIETAVPRLPEQQRIASCLSSLDTLITLETQKLEALKVHKKGLMQKLFPKMDGVCE